MAIRDGFNCYGHFYNLFLANQKIAECRSVLEIVKNNSSISVDKVSGLSPNAVVIMMNPGNSYPIRDTPERIDINLFDIRFNSKLLVAAFPDNTQIRIMKLMIHKNWQHVRVINLSDLREFDSDRLKQKIINFESITNTRLHSIFSNERKNEREMALAENTVPILLAWGTKDFLEETATRCIGIVNPRKTFGVPSTEFEHSFHHPLTRRVSWYANMVELLKNCK